MVVRIAIVDVQQGGTDPEPMSGETGRSQERPPGSRGCADFIGDRINGLIDS